MTEQKSTYKTRFPEVSDGIKEMLENSSLVTMGEIKCQFRSVVELKTLYRILRDLVEKRELVKYPDLKDMRKVYYSKPIEGLE